MGVKAMSNEELFRTAWNEWFEDSDTMKANREMAQRALRGDENADLYCERLCRLIEGPALQVRAALRLPCVSHLSEVRGTASPTTDTYITCRWAKEFS